MLSSMRRLSPRRNTSRAADVPGLVAEQLQHFGLDPATEFGRGVARIAERLYESQDALVKDCYLDTHRRYIESRPTL